MLLCLDVGNTHIVGGVFTDEKLCLKFRYATNQIGTADQFGLFLSAIFKENNLGKKSIKAVSIASVVPSCNFTLHHAVREYFPTAKCHVLEAKTIKGLNIKYNNPNEVGADLLAGALGGINAFPKQNLIIADLGTATTLTAIKNGGYFLGGVIMPGMRLAMESLTNNAARLTEIDIETPKTFLGQSTTDCIKSGLYYGHLGAMKEIIAGYKKELFFEQEVKIIATGGLAQLFRGENIFDDILPDLVLQGLRISYNEYT